MNANMLNRKESCQNGKCPAKASHIHQSVQKRMKQAVAPHPNPADSACCVREAAACQYSETELRLSEANYRRVFECSKDMIFIAQKDGRIMDLNNASADLLGYSDKQELMGLKSIDAVFDNPLHWKVFRRQIYRHGFVKDFEAVFRRQDGVRLRCLISGNAVCGPGGEIVGYEGIVKDITARMDAIQKLQEQHLELSVLNAVALAMNANQDLNEILDIALSEILKVLKLSVGGIFLINGDTHSIYPIVSRGLVPHVAEETCQVSFGDKKIMRRLQRGELSLTPSPIYPPFQAVLTGTENSPAIELTCFLIAAKERACGFFGLALPSATRLSNQNLRLLGSLGNFLGGAIENSRLQNAVRTHREELQRLTAKLLNSQEAERKRIAFELHDEAGQALVGINFVMENLEKELPVDGAGIRDHLREIKAQINHTYHEMRRISHRLHPSLLTDLGLEPALESYLTNISKQTGLMVDFKMLGFDERLHPEIETALYRLAQEALTNTLKHSRAKRFRLSLIKSYPHLIFSAEDDGTGFDLDELKGNSQSLGLLCMRERTAIMGGHFSFRSVKGKGTKIRIKIPIEKISGQCR